MKDFAKSIKTENKAIYDDKGQFIIGYVEKEGSEYVAYTHGITGAKSFLLKASDEKTATDELKDYAKLYWKKQGNKKVGNSKVGNANKIFSGKYLDIYDNGLVVAKEGWAFGESFNENTFGRWIDEQIRAKEKTLQECKQMKREFESNY